LKVLIFGGAGKIGCAAAWYLANQGDNESIGIVGRSENSLQKIKSWIDNDKVNIHVLDVSDATATIKLMGKYDTAIIALPERRSSYKTVESAIDAGIDAVDILEEYHRRPEYYETEGLVIPAGISMNEYGESLHKRALDSGVTILDGMGFAPGLSNITLGEGIKKINADYAVARVGGIPSKESAVRHPLRYMITWSFDHVIREYMVDVKVIQDGKLVEVKATSGRESFRFNEFGIDEELECAITPGIPSFLYTRQNLREFSEKTIRWPGHWQTVDALKECGLLDLEPRDFKGQMIVPREFFLSVVSDKLKPLPCDEDVCVMWNTVKGQNKRVDYYMWTEADIMNRISAMSKVTGFSAAIGSRLLTSGKIEQKGIVPPEDCITGDLYSWFIDELAKREILIKEIEASI
jgi:lysine 6-dehydrogenase